MSAVETRIGTAKSPLDWTGPDDEAEAEGQDTLRAVLSKVVGGCELFEACRM